MFTEISTDEKNSVRALRLIKFKSSKFKKEKKKKLISFNIGCAVFIVFSIK